MVHSVYSIIKKAIIEEGNMGIIKQKMMEEQNGHFEESTGLVAISGGYLDIQLDGNTICTVSIPVPNFMADRYRDSVVDWYEDFYDDEGNLYHATVYSSMYGIEWELDIEPNENTTMTSDEVLHNLSERIKIEMILTNEG